MLIRDSITGIGTVTYIDKTAGKFASLGHPVLDKDGQITPINGGVIYGCSVYEVKKGVRGVPGELHGIFENNNLLGKASVNCACGVYGEISSEIDYNKLQKVQTSSLSDVTIGHAEIYTTIYGNQAECYDISIVKVENNKDNRDFVIKIDDEKLKDKAGGIVQGMSGSPIIQNGKLVGAITHVFINDPTRGYGISIDKMLNSY
jgi:stage IV sporulation protein B